MFDLLLLGSDDVLVDGVKANASCRLIRRPRSLAGGGIFKVMSPRLKRRFSLNRNEVYFERKKNQHCILFTDFKLIDEIETIV